MKDKKPKRQLFLDTETTGIGDTHRILEVGIVEVIDRQITGNNYQCYINPERHIDVGAIKVHGITYEKIKDCPLFSDIVDEMLAFIGGSEVIIHNAKFDVGRLNYEFSLLREKGAKYEDFDQYCLVTDSLALAKKMFKSSRNNLDALCKRFNVNNQNRMLHGAVLDSELLAQVYIALTSGQGNLFAEVEKTYEQQQFPLEDYSQLTLNTPQANIEEKQLHDSFVSYLKTK